MTCIEIAARPAEQRLTSDASRPVLHEGKAKQGHLIVTLSLFFSPCRRRDECTVPRGEVSNASINSSSCAKQLLRTEGFSANQWLGAGDVMHGAQLPGERF